MKIPKYNSTKTYRQLITQIMNHSGAKANEDDLRGYEEQIVNFALECLRLNLEHEEYELFYDYIKYQGSFHLSAFTYDEWVKDHTT